MAVAGGDEESTCIDSTVFTSSPSPSLSGVYDHDNESKKDICGYVDKIASQDSEWIDWHRYFIMDNPLLESPLQSKVSVLKLKFTKNSHDFCKAFQISSPSVFDGGE